MGREGERRGRLWSARGVIIRGFAEKENAESGSRDTE